jgi:hypothetical protein
MRGFYSGILRGRLQIVGLLQDEGGDYIEKRAPSNLYDSDKAAIQGSRLVLFSTA